MTGHPFFDSGLLRDCWLGAFRAMILYFRPRLANRCKVEWFRLQLSLLQGRFARLQQPECRQVRQRRQSSASDSNFRSGKEECLACSSSSLRQRRMARLQFIVVASKKNGSPAHHRRSGKEEWPACSNNVCSGGDNVPRPILIFVAAKKNGPPAE